MAKAQLLGTIMMRRVRFLFLVLILFGFHFSAFSQKARTVQEIVDSLFPLHSVNGCAVNGATSAIPAPSLHGTRWDGAKVTGWIKHEKSCGPIRIVNKGKGNSRALEVENRIVRGDSILIATDYPWIEDDNELCSDFGQSHAILNRRGDTLRHWSSAWGMLDNFGALDSVNDSMIRFAGMAVSARAACGNVDTIIYRHFNGTLDTCHRCTEIVIHETYRYCASGYGRVDDRTHLFTGDSTACNLREVDSAIALINLHLRNFTLVRKGDEQERDRVIKIFATKKLCECDTTSGPFPANPKP